MKHSFDKMKWNSVRMYYGVLAHLYRGQSTFLFSPKRATDSSPSIIYSIFFGLEVLSAYSKPCSRHKNELLITNSSEEGGLWGGWVDYQCILLLDFKY